MKHMRQYLGGLYKEIILGPLFKLVEAVLELMVPLVMAGIIDTGIRSGDTAYILWRGALLVAIALLCVAAGMVCQYFAARAASAFGARLRKGLYAHVLTLSGPELERFGAGGLITRLTNDVNSVQTGLNMAIRLASRVPFLIVGSIVMALLINWKIGLVFLLSTPLIIAVLYLIMKRTVPRYTEIQGGQDALSRLSRENLAGTRVIRAFARQGQEKRDFDAAANELSGLVVRVGKVSAALNPLTTLIVNLAIIAIVWLGAGFAFGGQIEPGQIIALVSYMNQTLLALVVAANLVVLFTRALASIRRVGEVLDTPASITGGERTRGEAGAPALSLQNVRFAYHAGADDAVQNISFTMRRGETVGIIGGTGSGKTTLVELLLRNYEPSEGAVLVDGVPTEDYTLAALRAKIGVVPQRAALLSGSVRHNLQVSAPGASEQEMWHALRTAQGAEFVEKLPEGLDTQIEEGGKNLSGGQRQRLTIARALVRKPEILVLDDASSALDYATDAALRGALRREAAERGMTTLLIAQRASSIRHADQILVLDDGRLVGVGTHEELVQTSGVYREICASQGIGGEVGA